MMRKVSLLLPIVLLLSLMALLAGLWAGLLRLGWLLPEIQINLPPAHGPLMVSGFLGTVIALERVVALKKGWMYISPLLTGLGWVISLALPGIAIGTLMITLGSLGLVVILGIMVRREPALHTSTIGVGALCWFVGNLLWLLGLSIHQIVFWWAAFLILTITGERLELSRVLRMTRLKQILFLFSAGIFLAGVIIGMFANQLGARLAGLGMLGLALWLLWFDLARRNLRHRIPLTQYIARCLYAGYIWLGFGGIFSLWHGAVFAGPDYDAVLHSIFLGFVISMIFGHAPIILPSLLNRMLPYNPSFYLSLVFLHISLLIRIVGDLGGGIHLRQWGGLLNEISILLFLATMVVTLRSHSRQQVGVKS
jgi:hypothetical protein